MTTWMELAKETLPNHNEETLGFLLWNHTAFPFVDEEKIVEHLLTWEKKRRGGWSDCCFCGKAYRHPGSILLGGSCGKCD